MKPQKHWVIISGGSRGIGRASAEAFAREGFDVVAIARTLADLEAMRQSWQADFPERRLLICSADLSTREGRAQVLSFVHDRQLTLSVLINNAACFRYGTVMEEEAEMDRLLQLNLLAPYTLTRSLLPYFPAGKGHIFTIGSVAYRDWPAGKDLYAISKAALQSWHHYLRRALADRPLRVTLVTPGATLTSSWKEEELSAEPMLTAAQVAQTLVQLYTLDLDIEEIVIRPK